MKRISIVLILMVLVSCKSKQNIVTEQGVSEKVEVSKIIQGHYANKLDFQTASIRSTVGYDDGKTALSINCDIRIKKDETIMVTARALGLITVAKALITPERVSFYSKDGKYFDGDYRLLSKWLGTDLDFNKVQNLLLGRAIDDLTKAKYNVSIEGEKYKLKTKEGNNIIKEFLFEGANFLLKDQIVSQQNPLRSLEVNYPAYKSYDKATLPLSMNIDAYEKTKVKIEVSYNSISFDEKLNFPYTIPEGYEEIIID